MPSPPSQPSPRSAPFFRSCQAGWCFFSARLQYSAAPFFAVVAATTAYVRRNLPQHQWARAIGCLTVSFSIGQMVGPVATGLVTDLTHDLAGGLWTSTSLLLLASATGATQRDLPEA
ncbi:MAG: hypothetical protein B7X99_03360 [Rhizobiales bacterium 17-65-6]|nr:MAG: hypothetical protein B7X99_03360 [Rhizobiales bacterium 17-65-6]